VAHRRDFVVEISKDRKLDCCRSQGILEFWKSSIASGANTRHGSRNDALSLDDRPQSPQSGITMSFDAPVRSIEKCFRAKLHCPSQFPDWASPNDPPRPTCSSGYSARAPAHLPSSIANLRRGPRLGQARRAQVVVRGDAAERWRGLKMSEFELRAARAKVTVCHPIYPANTGFDQYG
jgi:hypothetical protein